MPVPTLTIIASLLQMHGPGATIQSDHKGIDALLGDIRGQISEEGVIPPTFGVTEVAFRKGGFVRGAGGAAGFRKGAAVGAGGAGAFRRGAYAKGGGGAFRRGGFARV
jgi:hypothetical protein